MTSPSPDLAQALGDLDAVVARIKALLQGAPAQPPGEIRLAATTVTADSVTVSWTSDRTDLTGWTLARDGVDARGSGPWSTPLTPAARGEFTFRSLLPGTAYRFTLTPVGGTPVTVTATTAGAPSTPGPGPQPGPGTTAVHGPRALADGWVPRLVAGDDFDGTAVDPKQWSVYNSVGHGGKGLRRASAFTIVADPTALGGRALRVTGAADGTTGGMAHKTNLRYGRWAARMRVPDGDPRYHPVLLTWPDAENWPEGGEIDFAEGKCGVDRMEFFLHYSKDNKQTSGRIDVDVSQWHWYEMQWGPDGVRGWCDGRLYFEDRDPNHSSFGAHHGTIQLDWFPGGAARTGAGEMLVDAYRVYSHPDTSRG